MSIDKSQLEYFMGMLVNTVKLRYPDKKPTVDEIIGVATELQTNMINFLHIEISPEDMEWVKAEIPSRYVHSMDYASLLKDKECRDGEHQDGWYSARTVENKYWNRYKEYLKPKWSDDVLNRLDEITDDVMNELGDPDSPEQFQRRGLLLGDVQSGKTATYTAICNKAADVGYKVIIVLAGVSTALRSQTQERLDMEFVGRDSRDEVDALQTSENQEVVGPKYIGVGLLDRSVSKIVRFTTVDTDFDKNKIKSWGLDLNVDDMKNTGLKALFVVKKNSRILKHLSNWLSRKESEGNEPIDLPMLLIDDEADNASINTSISPTERTAVNKQINQILRKFKKATYLGITATPFANIFIDPELEKDGAAKDLFPRHFLMLLPTPSNYIGLDKMFGNGDVDSDNEDSESGKYADSLIPIENQEQTEYFAFKHKKDLADYLTDLPESLREAVRYFVLATVASNLRRAESEHRSMLINVSRFIAVQNKVQELVGDYVNRLKADIRNYGNCTLKDQMQIKSLRDLKGTWDKFNFEKLTGKIWENVAGKDLESAIKRIKTVVVNTKSGDKSSDPLGYYKQRAIGRRVIAVGGNSLSRGLTLEGLCVSYFYRNTKMYDTLMQMGRWFGYREHYDDLFKVWMGEDIIGWFGAITDAFNELKDDIRVMAASGGTPADFGLRVRSHPGTLMITARNKMRLSEKYKVPITLARRMIETSRMINDVEQLKRNNTLCESFIASLVQKGFGPGEYDAFTNSIIWKDVPREIIVKLIEHYKSHPWNLNFQSEPLAKFIGTDDKLEKWDIGIPFGAHTEDYILNLGNSELVIKPEKRKVLVDETLKRMLRVSGRHVRIGSGACTKIGLSRQQIEQLRSECEGRPKDSTYLIPKRNPLALLHLIYNSEHEVSNTPKYLWGIGLGFPGGRTEKTATYEVNPVMLRDYLLDTEKSEGDEDEDFI